MLAALSRWQTGQIIVVAQQGPRCATIFEVHAPGLESFERTFEVQSPVVSHARLGQTPVGGPPWRFSVTAGPVNVVQVRIKGWSC